MTEPSTRADEAAIRAVVDRWLEATRAGDLEAVLDLMTDDVVFLVPDAPAFGKAEFADAMAVDGGVEVDASSAIEEVQVLGEWAFIVNHLEVRTTPPEGATVRRSGNTLTLLRRGDDGRWRVARDANLVTEDR